MGQELVGGLGAAGHDDEVAVDRATVDDELANPALAALRLDRLRPPLSEVDHLRHRDARLAQHAGRGQATVVHREYGGALAGPDRPGVDEPADGAGEHDPDEVVTGEHERLLGDPRGHDHVVGPHLDEEVAAVDGHEAAFVDADRPCRRQHLDARVAGALSESARVGDPVGVGEQAAARLGALVHERDVAATLGRFDGCFEAGAAAADDEHLHVAVLDVEAICRGAGRIDRSEPGGAPQELLVQRPQPLRPDEHLVVEARRRERPADLVRDRHPVPIERADDVLALDDDALTERLGADADVGNAVHRHLAVRAVSGAAEQSSGPVVLEAAGEDAPPGRVQGRRDRVARVSLEALAVELEREALAPVDTLVWACREARHQVAETSSAAFGFGAGASGSQVRTTSFVRVSRSARNQASQPCRWNHHSVCTPAALSRK